MRTCECGQLIPSYAKIAGVAVSLKRRVHCLICKPYQGGYYGNESNLIGQRKCPSCEETKDLTLFYRVKDTPSGYCKKCDKERVNTRNKQKKQDAVDYKGGKCQICHYKKCLSAMEFHHVDRSKKEFTIAYLKGREVEEIKGELDKTVLLCCRCHREVEDGITECPALSILLSF